MTLARVIRRNLVSIRFTEGRMEMRATEDVAELYRSLAGHLEQIVRTGVKQAPDAIVEDACQSAWDRLVHHHARVQRETALAWLAQTAVRGGRKLLGRGGRLPALGAAPGLAVA